VAARRGEPLEIAIATGGKGQGVKAALIQINSVRAEIAV